MLELLARPAEEMRDKMHRALNYLHTFWTQLFKYWDDGDYSIDNMAAERAIRPMTVQRLCRQQHNRPYVAIPIMLA
jgi:hypothetical protein